MRRRAIPKPDDDSFFYIFELFYNLALSLNSNTQCLAVVCFTIIIQPIQRAFAGARASK